MAGRTTDQRLQSRGQQSCLLTQQTVGRAYRLDDQSNHTYTHTSKDETGRTFEQFPYTQIKCN